MCLSGVATLRQRPFLVGGRRESFSFVTKREAEKSRYFRGAGHGPGGLPLGNPKGVGQSTKRLKMQE